MIEALQNFVIWKMAVYNRCPWFDTQSRNAIASTISLACLEIASL